MHRARWFRHRRLCRHPFQWSRHHYLLGDPSTNTSSGASPSATGRGAAATAPAEHDCDRQGHEKSWSAHFLVSRTGRTSPAGGRSRRRLRDDQSGWHAVSQTNSRRTSWSGTLRWGLLRDSDPFVGSTTTRPQPNYGVAFEMPVP